MRWQTNSVTSNLKSAGLTTNCVTLSRNPVCFPKPSSTCFLKTALPVRLSDEDKKALQNELHGIADNAVSEIHKERERTEKEIRKNNSRVSIPQTTFWCMIALLLLLAMFFALVLFANVKLLHSGALTEIIIICAILITITLTVTALIFYRQKH